MFYFADACHSHLNALCLGSNGTQSPFSPPNKLINSSDISHCQRARQPPGCGKAVWMQRCLSRAVSILEINAHQTAFGPFIDALPTIYKHDSLDKVRKLYAHEQGNLGMNDHQHVHQDLQCSRRY
jgi:hypothetical protein